MNKREEIQNEALAVAIKYQKAGLALSVGIGKTLIGLNYIEHFFNNNSKIKVLIVSPTLSIINNWKNEITKFNKKYLLDSIEFITYRSINKYDSSKYDILILEECHNLLYNHSIFLQFYKGRILGLTGTPPRYDKSEKGEMVIKYCPIVYKYITDDAIDDEILNDYIIYVHKLDLSTEPALRVELKNNTFYTSERKNYEYWTRRIMEASTKKQEQIASIMRMKALMDFKTKEIYAKHILDDITDKCIVFCNTQDQADRMCKYSYHSNNSESEDNLQKFKDGKILNLSCVLQLNEGVNIPNLKTGIILHSYGNERKASQRIGRLLRLNPKETSVIHILCYKNTVDERWVAEALRDLDVSKIKYFDTNESAHNG